MKKIFEVTKKFILKISPIVVIILLLLVFDSRGKNTSMMDSNSVGDKIIDNTKVELRMNKFNICKVELEAIDFVDDEIDLKYIASDFEDICYEEISKCYDNDNIKECIDNIFK